jgi:hypothetical protein
MKSMALTVAGVVMLAAGILFALQGAGIVHWPAESSMLGERAWIENGIVLALIGVAGLLAAHRIRQR